MPNVQRREIHFRNAQAPWPRLNAHPPDVKESKSNLSKGAATEKVRDLSVSEKEEMLPSFRNVLRKLYADQIPSEKIDEKTEEIWSALCEVGPLGPVVFIAIAALAFDTRIAKVRLDELMGHLGPVPEDEKAREAIKLELFRYISAFGNFIVKIDLRGKLPHKNGERTDLVWLFPIIIITGVLAEEDAYESVPQRAPYEVSYILGKHYTARRGKRDGDRTERKAGAT